MNKKIKNSRYTTGQSQETASDMHIFKAMADHSADWSYWVDANGELRYTSRAFTRITGFPLTVLKANPKLIFDIIHPDDRSLMEKHIDQDYKSCEIQALEFRIITKDGKIRWIKHECQSLYDRDGIFIGRHCRNRDITDEKSAQAAKDENLRVLNEERRIFSSGPVIVFKWKNAPGWPVEYVSDNVKEVFDYSMNDFLSGKISYAGIIPEEDLARVAEEVRSNSAGGALNFHHQPYRIIRKSGQPVWLLDYTVILRNQRGEITHYVGYVADISEQKRNEEHMKAILRQTELLQQTIEGLNRCGSLQEMYELAAEGILRIMQADRSAVLLFDDGGKSRFKAWKNLSEKYRQAVEGHNPWQIKDLNARPVYIPDIKKSGLQKPVKNAVIAEGIGSLLFVPMIGIERLIGKLMIYFDLPGKCNEQEIQLSQVIAQNLTAVILRQQALENSIRAEQKYRVIFNNSAEGIYQSTPEGRFITVNPAMAKLFGYHSPEDMLKIKNTNVLYWDAEERRRLVKLANDEESLENVEVKMKRADGSPIWVLMNDHAVRDETGRTLYYEGALLDISGRKNAEQLIRDNEQRLQTLINSTPDIICFKDGQGRWLVANDSDLELFSLKGVDYHGKTDSELAEFTNPIYREAFLNCEETDEKAWQAGGVSRDEEMIPKADGAVNVYDIIKAPVFESSGARKGLVVLGRDITEQKKAENEKEIFKDLLNRLSKPLSMQDCAKIIAEKTQKLFKHDAFSLDIIDAPNNMLMGIYNEDTLPGKNTPQETPVNSHSLDKVINKDVLAGKTKLINRKEKPQQSNYYIFGDESQASMSLMFVPILYETKPIGILSVQSYIRDKYNEHDLALLNILGSYSGGALVRIKAEEELRHSEKENRRLAMLVDQTSESIVITDLDGRMEYVNPAFETISGYTVSEALGQIMNIFRSEEQDDQVYNELWEKIRNGQVWSGRLTHVRKNGSKYHVEAVIFPVKDIQGQINNYCMIARDVSREEALEAQLRQAQKMEAIGTLAGGVAHDFNNLLTVINGYADLELTKISPDHPLHNALSAILQAGKRAENLTSQLLAFSRKQIYKAEIIDLNQVISGVYKILRRLIDEDVGLDLHLAENLPCIKADASQIEQILINLIVNARDALAAAAKPHFRKRITIESGRKYLSEEYIMEHAGSRAGEHVLLAVSDNGVGMEATVKERIFEPFFTTKEVHKGTGLGLSMVYGIVKQNMGCIYVYSEPGQGTTFKIYWPAAQETAGIQEVEVHQELIKGTERILVVEDDEDVRTFVVEALSAIGYTVRSAANGHTALQLIESEALTFDLLLTDLIMPEMNGKDLAIRLSEIIPQIKIIFASGYTDNHIVHDGSLQKGVNFINKPYTVETLAKEIRRVLERT